MFSIGARDDTWEADRQWLEELQEVELPPMDTLLDSCLIQPIQEQVQLIQTIIIVIIITSTITIMNTLQQSNLRKRASFKQTIVDLISMRVKN